MQGDIALNDLIGPLLSLLASAAWQRVFEFCTELTGSIH